MDQFYVCCELYQILCSEKNTVDIYLGFCYQHQQIYLFADISVLLYSKWPEWHSAKMRNKQLNKYTSIIQCDKFQT